MFPTNAAETLDLGRRLISYLQSSIQDTKSRKAWSLRNFDALRTFASELGAESYPSGPETPSSERKPEFLWDYSAYGPGGILIAAESEFDQHARGLKHDFEKLLYVRSPLKLMMTRIKSAEEAEEQASYLSSYMDKCCARYTGGEVFILYCVWWADDSGHNRDIAYILQVPGEPTHQTLGSARFNQVVS